MRGAVVVRLTAAVLASVAVISGFVNLTRFTDADQLPSAAINDLRADRRDVTALRFLVTATGLNPEEHTLHAAVSFVPTMNDPEFVDLENRPIVDPATAKLRPEFTDLALSITVDNMWVGGVTVPYPLAAVLESAPLLGNPAVNVAIPADVDPDSFPNDTYAFDLSLYVQLPPGVFADDPPVMVGMAADSRLGQWHLDADRIAEPSDSPYPESVKAVFSRGWDFSAFVYAVSLMPAVIGLGFMVRRHGKPNPGDTAAALELAAALLALIALRQVFVPANISGLTRLDLLLGVQLALLCALMAAAYVRTPEPAPQTPPPTPPPTSPPAPPAERPTAAINVALVVLVWLGFLLGRQRAKRRGQPTRAR